MATCRYNDGGIIPFYGYTLDQSCRFNDDDSAYLMQTAVVPTEGRTWTYAFGIKRGNLTGTAQYMLNGESSSTLYTFCQFHTDNTLRFYSTTDALMNFQTNAVFRDVENWYYIQFIFDSTDATAADRMKIYVNGVRQDVIINNAISLDATTYINANTVSQRIGRYFGAGGYLDAYLSEVNFIDGQALTPSSFGQFKSDIWIPKKYTGSYGINGFHLDFADSADLGNDVSGNNNDFTSSGLTAEDQVLDSPTNNYPTLSPLNKPVDLTLTNGNLNAGSGSVWRTVLATEALPLTGKWYFEYKFGSDVNALVVGVQEPQDATVITTGWVIGQDTTGWGIDSTGSLWRSITNGAHVETLTGDTPSAGDVLQVAIDMDAGKMWFGSNNIWLSSGDPVAGTDEAFSGLPNELVPGVSINTITDTDSYINFGQLGFAHTPPTGFKALNSENIAKPTIKDSSTGFDTVLYEGTGAEQSITDLSFQPDLVWIKNRDAADEHKLIDTVRGATFDLSSDSVTIETEDVNGLTVFLSNGFTLGSGANGYNDNGESFVAWCFRMGAKYGFDIITDEGTGIAHAINHNLGGVPELIIRKCLTQTQGWETYHHHALNKTDPETDHAYLHLSNAWSDLNTIWNDTAPTSTQFTVGTENSVNMNAQDYITCLWRSIPQFSKVFSYKGNGNINGPVVYCGFRPRYILNRRADVAGSWFIIDAARYPYNNPTENYLMANTAGAEASTTIDYDILANGFKLRSTEAQINANNGTFVGIAYAEQPGKYSNAR